MFYETTVTLPLVRLRGLIALIQKIQIQAQDREMTDDQILDLRLSPDMFPFSRQIQIASDNAKGMASRMAGREIPVYDDTETTLDELITRLEHTIAYLETFTPEDFVDAETTEVRFRWFPGKKFVGAGYVLTYGIPNFLFHTVTAYDILRHHGFDIGKADFVGPAVALMDDEN